MTQVLRIFISGTTRGIGKYLTDYYLTRGHIVIGCSRGENHIHKDKNYEHFCVDISDENQVNLMFNDIRKKFKYIDVCINNAAISPDLSLSLFTSAETIRRCISINIFGNFIVSREAARLMLVKGGGRIINFSSMAVKHHVAGEAIYTATKSAIESITKVMAKEFYKNNITCNAIAPSAINTEMTKKISEKALMEVLSRNAVTEFGQFRDVSNVTDWLIDPASMNITGQVIYLGGA